MDSGDLTLDTSSDFVQNSRKGSSMKYLVCSDIHGDEKAFSTIIRLKEDLGCEAIISAGDFCPTSEMEVMAYNTDFITVMGNCDRYHSLSLLSAPRDFIRFDFGVRKAVITHGDHYQSYQFQLEDGDIFISGHTHRSRLEKDGEIIFLNPGSPTRPRDGVKSFAILDEKGIFLLTFPNARVFKELLF